jgi:hypothetical protein
MSTRAIRPAGQWGGQPLGYTRPSRPAGWNLAGVAVTDTGLRGFLKWARQEYPAAVYQKIAAGIQQAFPQAFSGYMLGGWRNLAKLNGLADSTTPTVDTADAANSTPISPSWSDAISQIIGTATGAYLNVAQQQNQQAVLNAQLQAAQNGRAPLPISLSSSGITFGSTAALSAGGLAIAGIVGFIVLKAMGVIK